MAIHKRIARLLPENVKAWFSRSLKKSTIDIDPERFAGFVFLFGIGVGHTVSYAAVVFLGANYFLWLPATTLVTWALFILWIVSSIDAKKKYVEDVLPDFLQLLSANLKAGLTIERALAASAREGFGPLADMARITAKKIIIGVPERESILSMNEYCSSKKLKRATELLVRGQESGGDISSLLDEISRDLRGQALLEKNIQTSVLMYVSFLFIIIALGAPVLFALSGFLVGIVTEKIPSVPQDMVSAVGASMPINLQRRSMEISEEFIRQYSMVALLVISSLSSLVLGIIRWGKAIEGLRYTIPMIAIALSVYFATTTLLNTLLGSLF